MSTQIDANDDSLERALRGAALYGDFTADKIATWFSEEEQGYYDVSEGTEVMFGHTGLLTNSIFLGTET